MPIQPPRPVLERILLFGGPGSGKSFAWLQIAKLHQQTGSDAKFYVLDTDAAIDRMLCDEQFSSLANVIPLPTYEWPDYTRNLDQALSQVRSHDWLICDLCCNSWEAVQSYYTESVFGKESEAFFLEHRKKLVGKTGLKQDDFNPLDGWKDWSFIKKLMRAFETKLTLRPRCHILCCNTANALDEKNDPKTLLEMYRGFGAKPAGFKKFDHGVHTVIGMSQTRPGDYKLTTCKDRGREPFLFEPVSNFAVQYLMGRAGWRVA